MTIPLTNNHEAYCNSKISHPTMCDKVVSLFAMCLLFISLFACPIGIYFILYGGIISRALAILLYLYQIFFAEKSKVWVYICRKLHSTNYFRAYGCFVDSKSNDINENFERLSLSKSLFAVHPHGIFSIGFMIASVHNNFFGSGTICSSRALIYTPFTGLFAIWLGFKSVDPSQFKKVMEKGENIAFVPGGFEEATITSNEMDKIFIKDRKGFIKYAIQYGYTIYPTYTFNEARLFKTFNLFQNIRLLLNKLKIPTVIFIGPSLGFPDHNQKLVTVISSGIKVSQTANPSDDLINEYHKKYIEELEYIYYKYQPVFGGSKQLQIL